MTKTEMIKKEITLPKPLHYRIQEISNLLDIDFDEIFYLCTVDGGYYRYWSLIDRLRGDIPELLDEEEDTDTIYEIKRDLTKQFHDRYELIKDIDSLERKFEKKYKSFDSDLEQHRSFLNFIDTLQDKNIITQKEVIPKEIEVIPQTPPISKKFLIQETVQKEKREKPAFPKLFPKEYIPMLGIMALANFIVLTLLGFIWPQFNIRDILLYSQVNLIPFIGIICLVSLISGLIYRHYYLKLNPVNSEKD